MKLIVLKNNVPLNEVTLDFVDAYGSYEIFIGRADDCHVIIDDPLISRHHLVIKNQNEKWYCEKLSELGVLLINGSLITQTEISGGEEIKFGPYTLIPVDLPQQASAPQLKVDESPAETEEVKESVTIEDIPESDIPEPVEKLEEETEILSESANDFQDGDAFQHSSEEGSGDFEENSFSDQEEGYSDLDSNFEDQSMDLVNTEDNEADDVSTDFSGDEYSDGFGGGDLDGYSGGVDGYGEDEGTRFLKAFINYQLVIFGEYAPYDRYQLDSDEVFIGRDPNKCQIILNDPEVSSVHAVVRKNGNEITLEDMNSSNGTLLHGERINKAHILTGDEFLIGSTTFTLDIKSDLLEAEADRLMPVESGQVIETEEYEEEEVDLEDADISFDGPAEPEEKSIIKRILKNPQQRKKAIYAIGGSLLVGLLLYEPDEEVPVTAQKAPEEKVVQSEKPRIQLSPELENRRNVSYELGVSFFEQNKYFEALKEFESVVAIDPEYKNVQTYLEQTRLGLKQLEELEAKKRAEEERIALKKVIDELLVKAREAVQTRQVQLAENYFAQIVEKDPENMEIQQLKLELEIWQKEEERKRLEQAAKDAARKTMVDALAPGKTFYLKKDWYKAILKLEEFLNRKGNDEDLIKEASGMLSDARSELAQELGPLLGRARSLKEGQDLKNAYDAYLNILKIEPTNAEALNEIDSIRNQIDTRSKRLYREAIISESLSLFNDAREKLQEVQQISPTDSEYYKKASEKLKTYLE